MLDVNKCAAKTSSRNILDECIELLQNYDNLKEIFNQTESEIKKTNHKRYDDMQYFYKLRQAFRYYKQNRELLVIDFKTPPNVSNAR